MLPWCIDSPIEPCRADVEANRAVIDEFKLRYWESDSRWPKGYDGVISQAWKSPDISVAIGDALNRMGYDVMNLLGVGGKDSESGSLLWASTVAGPETIKSVRTLKTKIYPRFSLGGILFTASGGELPSPKITDEGLQLPKENVGPEPDPSVVEIFPQAFLTSEIVRVIRGYGLYPRDQETYGILRQAGVSPLGFEEMAGLAHGILRDFFVENPDLEPPKPPFDEE